MPKPTYNYTIYAHNLPLCDVCVGRLIGAFNPDNDSSDRVRYDAPTAEGHWGSFCQKHFEAIAVGTLATRILPIDERQEEK